MTAGFETILCLLTAALLMEAAARRLRVPPSAVLVAGGIVLALIPGAPSLELDPDLILTLFLPPLLFSSAYFTVWRDFRANLRPILQLAVGAVAFTTLAVALVSRLLFPGMPWAACFALGAVVSPPDAVAAKAVLKGLPLPSRLVTLLEGESLVNDAAGLVLFRVAIAAGLTGSFDAWDALGDFAIVSAGGVAAGLVFGHSLAFALRRVASADLNIVGGMLGAWGAYVGGDLLHVSGVLSTVACGLVVGWKQHEVLPAKTRTEANAVWNVVVFLLESLIFVLIGLALRGVARRLHEAGIAPLSLLGPAAGIAAVMVAARFAWIIPTTYVGRFLFPGLRRHDPYPLVGVPVVMSWAGMRGVVSLAVALSLPQAFPARDTLLAVTLGAVLASILLQGTTLAPLIRALRLGGFQLEVPPTLDEAHTRARVYGAALGAIRLASRRSDGGERHPRLLEQYGYRSAMAERRAAAGAVEHGPERRAHYEAVLAANSAARLELLGLHRAGRIHDSVLDGLEAELDLEELSARHVLAEAELCAAQPALRPEALVPQRTETRP